MRSWLVEAYIAIGLMAGVVAGLFVAFQIQREFALDLGGPYDGPFLQGFHDRESNREFTFRWTTPSARITLPSVGVAEWVGRMKVATPPVGSPWQVTLDGHEKQLTPGVSEIELGPKVPDIYLGAWTLDMQSAAFRPQADPRALGVALDRVVISTGSAIIWPPLAAYLEVGLVVIWVYLASRILAWPRKWAAVASGASLVLMTVLTAWDRPNTYVLWPRLPVLIGLWTAGLVLGLWVQGHGRPREVVPIFGRRLASTVLVLETMAASTYIFHPQAYVWDLIFHVHRLEFVAAGQIAVPVVSAEFGTRPIPYPPISYLPLLPAFWSGLNGELLMRVALSAALVALIAVSVWLASKVPADVGFTALMLAGMPILVMALSWGIYANLVGLVAACALIALAMERSGSVGQLLAGSAAALSHVSMAVIVPLVLLLGGVWQKVWAGKGFVRLALLAGAVAVVSYGAFYFLWTEAIALEARDILARRASSPSRLVLFVGGSVSDAGVGLSRVRLVLGTPANLPPEPGFRTEQANSPVEALLRVARGAYSEVRAYYRVWPALLVPFGLLLLALARKMLPLALLLAILCAAALLWAVGVATGLFVRYALLAAPAVAILAAETVSSLANRGTMGRLVVLSIFAYQIYEGAMLWSTRLLTVGH